MSEYQKPSSSFWGEEPQWKKNRKISQTQEKKISKTGGKGKLTPGSGNKGIKGDVWKPRTNPFFNGRMYEAKTTEKASLKVERAWLEKLERESNAVQKEPVLVIGFYSDSLRQTDWGAIPLSRLEELYELERRYYEEENGE